MSNICCRIFKEQIELIKQLPEQDRALVLYAAVIDAFNQFDNQNGSTNLHLSENSKKLLKDLFIPIGDLNKGINHWNWKGGITNKNKKDRAHSKYRSWRNAVLIRDNNRCKICGSPYNLEAHHKKRFHSCIQERFSVENGETLCKKCHISIHKKEGFI